MVPLGAGPQVTGAGRGGQGVQDGLDHRGALGGQIAVDDAGAAERGGQGHAAVRARVPVEDFQATITEVRPASGDEEYVTSGFLRSTNQVDRSDSTSLFTDPTYLAGEDRMLSSGLARRSRTRSWR